jgi:hypothetical protein
MFLAIATLLVLVLAFDDSPVPPELGHLIIFWLVVIAMGGLGGLFTLLGVGKWRRVGFLSEHGLRLMARVVQIDGTSTRIGHLPVYRLTVEVPDAAQQSYRAELQKALHAHEASAIIGKELRIIVHPTDRTNVILDEADQV